MKNHQGTTAEVIRREHLGERRYFVRLGYRGDSVPLAFIRALEQLGFVSKGQHIERREHLHGGKVQYIMDMVKEGSGAGGDWTPSEQASIMDALENLFSEHGFRWFPRRWLETDLP